VKKGILAFFGLSRQARQERTADCSLLNKSDPCHFRQQGGKTLAFFIRAERV
jgi:hypothetical protein